MTTNTVYDKFVEGFVPYQGNGQILIPRGWSFVWRPGTEEERAKGILVRPEMNAEVNNPYSPPASAAFRHRSATFDAALTRVYMVPEHKRVLITARARIITEPGDGGAGVQVGIDPLGRETLDLTYQDIEWGEWYSQYMPVYDRDRWQTMTAQAEAQVGQVTVYLRATLDYRANAVGIFYDDFAISYETALPPVPSDWVGRLRACAAELTRLADEMAETLED